MDEPEQTLVTVFASGSRIEIEIAEILLRDAGIESYTVGDEMQDLFALGRIGSGVNPVTGPTWIQVRPEDEAEAREVLSDWDRMEGEA